MEYIMFCDEVIRVPESVTFWIMDQGPEYRGQYCVNMSPLTPQNFMGEPNINDLIRSEGYLTLKDAQKRLNELLELLNK